jgi:hypothetical protein
MSGNNEKKNKMIVLKKTPQNMIEKESEREAIEFLKSSNKQSIFNNNYNYFHIGDEIPAYICFLATLTRVFPPGDTVSVILTGDPGIGKSNMCVGIERITPEKAVFNISRITHNAFTSMARMYKNILKNKVVIMTEIEGAMGRNSYFVKFNLNSLLSENELNIVTSQKGELERIELKGPIVLLGTTSVKIDDELSSRVILTPLDPSNDQTARIVSHHQKQVSSYDLENIRNKIIRKYHLIHELLPVCDVKIPFAENISFPTTLPRFRRDFVKFKNLIKASAYLNQKLRKQVKHNGRPVVNASIEDYEAVHKLILPYLTSAVVDLDPTVKRMWNTVVNYINKKSKEEGKPREEIIFTRSDLVKDSCLTLRQVRYGLAELAEQEYLRVIRGWKGQEYQYQLNSDNNIFKKDLGLTSPKELEKAIKNNLKTR